MEIRTPKVSQILMTGLGLIMFALAMMLNHFHPHNQGIADITRGSFYKRFAVANTPDSAGSSLTYAAALPKIKAEPASKLVDPTGRPGPKSQPDASLPTVALAKSNGGSSDVNKTANPNPAADERPQQSQAQQREPDDGQQ